MDLPAIASPAEWRTARLDLLEQEKELSRARDRVAAARRRLPMVEMEKEYVFESTDGKATLLDLFEGRRQLLVWHFMWLHEEDAGCDSCSFTVDNIGHLADLHARDTSLVLVSRDRSRSSRGGRSAWDGRCRGTRRSAATSTTTST